MTLWSDPACDALLRRAIAEKHTYRRICGIFAEELGIALSRNAVIGRVNRLGLSKPRETKPKQARVRRPPRPAAPPEPPPPVMFRLPLLRLQSRHCRYPNEDASFYCGAPKADGSPYCEAHHRICYVGSSWRA